MRCSEPGGNSGHSQPSFLWEETVFLETLHNIEEAGFQFCDIRAEQSVQ